MSTAIPDLRDENGACFAAGTLVHTKEGLKPIDQIKVGDWVLSRPENPEQGGATDYKRVVRTMVHHDKPVIYGTFVRPPPPDNRYKFGRVDAIMMTPDHPFWVQHAGWTVAAQTRDDSFDWTLFPDGVEYIRFIDYRGAPINGGYSKQVLVTNDPDVGWVRGSSPIYVNGWGDTYRMSTGQRLADAPWDKFEDYLDEIQNTGEELELDHPIDRRYIFRATVYNVEVEDWHTYFVGELGVWVHNADCGDLAACATKTSCSEGNGRAQVSEPTVARPG